MRETSIVGAEVNAWKNSNRSTRQLHLAKVTDADEPVRLL